MLAVERLLHTIGRKSCDRPPVIPQIFAHAAKVAGRSVDDYLSSSAFAAECQVAAWRHYGLDAVFAVLDLTIEAEALGATLTRHPGIYPAVAIPPFTPDRDFSRMASPEPATAGRMPEVVDMVARLRAGIGDAAVLVGMVQGPMTLAVQLIGLERSLFLAIDETERFLHLLDYTTGISRTFGLAQLAAGADVVMVFEPAACPEILPPAMFRELIGPRAAHLAAAFRGAGAKANWLHIAGQTAAILPYYSAFGFDIANIDYCVDLDRARDITDKDTLCLNGNVKPLSFITDGADNIRQIADSLLARFDGRGGFILSSGCEIPPEAEEANVAAMVAAARYWRSQQT